MNNFTKITKMVEVFGFQVPADTYYLHRGHAWARLEGEDQVRVGLDDFSQKILGPYRFDTWSGLHAGRDATRGPPTCVCSQVLETKPPSKS